MNEAPIAISARGLSRRFGALVAVYRHINDNIKMGVGYNFTDFSDDLTHLNYDRRGFFVNALAKY